MLSVSWKVSKIQRTRYLSAQFCAFVVVTVSCHETL